MENKALFLDLDGTIIETRSGNVFPKDADDWKFKAGMLEQICRYKDAGYLIFIVSNQAGVNKGYIRPSEFDEKLGAIILDVDRYYQNTRLEHQIVFNRAFISYHKDCLLRKPKPLAALRVLHHHDVDLAQSLMVGDASGKESLTPSVPKKYKTILDRAERLYSHSITADTEKRVIETKQHQYIAEKVGDKWKYYTIKKDFSDSDLMFARNSGLNYLDVEDFLLSSPDDPMAVLADGHSDLNEIPLAKDCPL